MKATVAFAGAVLVAGAFWPAAPLTCIAPAVAKQVAERQIEVNEFSFPDAAHESGRVTMCWGLGSSGKQKDILAAEHCLRDIPSVQVETSVLKYCWNGRVVSC